MYNILLICIIHIGTPTYRFSMVCGKIHNITYRNQSVVNINAVETLYTSNGLNIVSTTYEFTEDCDFCLMIASGSNNATNAKCDVSLTSSTAQTLTLLSHNPKQEGLSFASKVVIAKNIKKGDSVFLYGLQTHSFGVYKLK